MAEGIEEDVELGEEEVEVDEAAMIICESLSVVLALTIGARQGLSDNSDWRSSDCEVRGSIEGSIVSDKAMSTIG